MTSPAGPAAQHIAVPDDVRARWHTLEHHHLLRVPLFLCLFVAVGCGSVWLQESGAPFVARVPLYLLSAAAIHGVSLFTHEGVHGALSRRQWLNRLLSALCAWPVLQNFSAYRVLHLRHHAHLGESGDPDHYPNYASWTWGELALCWGRLLIGYPVYIAVIPFMGARLGTWRERFFIITESVAALSLVCAAWVFLPSSWMVHGWLWPMVCINTMVNIRGMSQHTLLPQPQHPIRGSRTILCNPVVRFFMCNENYHLEHHLFPAMPWYHLKEVHEVIFPSVQSEAPVIHGYFQFVREFVVASVRNRPTGTVVPRG